MKKYSHIILVSIDTLRADCLSASPRAKDYLSKYKTNISPKTNSLDKILNSGLYYNNCFSAAPYTSASHAAYFTGMWPLHNGVYEFFNRKINKPTIFEYAKKRGYKTIFQTDFPVILGPYLGFDKGVNHYFVENETKALKALFKNGNNKTLSFFHFGGVHYPYGFHTLKFGGKEYLRKVKFLEKKYNISRKEREKLDDVLDETYRSKRDISLLLRYKYIIEKLYNNKHYDKLFALYLEGINFFFKYRFDKFLKELKTFVDKNNAILFIFSDHGEEWDKNSHGHHDSLSDNVLRVPLIVYGKGVKPGIKEELIRTIDLAPTLVSLFQDESEKIKMDGLKLNLFDSNTNDSLDEKFALAQIWPAIATRRDLANYQNEAIKHKKLATPLNTYLSSEVIRNSDGKLAKYYTESGQRYKEEFFPKDMKKGVRSKLKRKLNEYNSSRQAKKYKISKIELKIRNELNNLGYKV